LGTTCRRSEPLDETGIAVLKALATFSEPVGCKEVAERRDLKLERLWVS